MDDAELHAKLASDSRCLGCGVGLTREACGCWTDDLRTRWCRKPQDGSESVLHSPATGTQPRACQSTKAGIWASPA